MEPTPPEPEMLPHADLVAATAAGRDALMAAAAARRAVLPLRFWRQPVHLTVPAGDFDRIRKAVERGLGAVPPLLARHGLGIEDVARALGADIAVVEELLCGDPSPSVVLIDAEDAEVPRPDRVAACRANAIRAFTTLGWGRTLRFYRPSGLDLAFCSGDLVSVLTGIAAAPGGRTFADYPLDGIVWPKAEDASEIRWLCETLGAIEHRLGLPENRIRLQFLVEGGRAAAQVTALAEAALPRLCGIVFGIADYSADLGLPALGNTHPVCDWARAGIVNAAGAAGVPAIDCMTMAYPVADAEVTAAANRERILARMRQCHDDALHGFQLGMSGKWAGHPLQLVAVLVAERSAAAPDTDAEALRALEAYARAVEEGRGTTVIGGGMADRATDRHVRTRLRRALAMGRLDPARAIAAGIVSAAEVEA